jgi:hypothetical protein
MDDCRNAQYLLRNEVLMKANDLEILELRVIAYILVLRRNYWRTCKSRESSRRSENQQGCYLVTTTSH